MKILLTLPFLILSMSAADLAAPTQRVGAQSDFSKTPAADVPLKAVEKVKVAKNKSQAAAEVLSEIREQRPVLADVSAASIVRAFPETKDSAKEFLSDDKKSLHVPARQKGQAGKENARQSTGNGPDGYGSPNGIGHGYGRGHGKGKPQKP